MDTSLRRRHALRLIGAALAAATFAAPALAGHDNPRRGHLFTSTNAPAGNEVLVYEQQDGGAPSLESRVATAGVGTGAGLGSQGAVTRAATGASCSWSTPAPTASRPSHSARTASCRLRRSTPGG